MTGHTSIEPTGAGLSLHGVRKSFGSYTAVDDVTLDVLQGELLGLIGPNGAGKTTLFNIVTGFVRPDVGRVVFEGADVTRLKPDQRVRRGLVRTFQKSMVFPELSAEENIAMAARARQGSGYAWWRPAERAAEALAEGSRLLRAIGLERRGALPVGALSHGEQRMVDILVSLALRPRLLLMDEPTAGLTREETARVMDLVRAHDRSTTVVLIAHDLDVVFSLCERIAVLNLGALLAVGSPEEIRANPEVRTAYLGSHREH
ncbi:ABC transporter ATP-binding protein [Azospirillum sp. RWY-5-1]|uniref:ABC transporter ATP-binding protein n=1 Tax=Azospirillum oleiclasticum TaxID=2735135 RepID=A0ABX2T2B7_9PROT|nr:ABC transporter ATP-binding protein [Azospirillum oleiclasticum]NYZ11288.1 ABC transporter ATP-binding protein [Azospirillum oleiclasticum]NYZ18449.1 ABC transporter ATP-binding protein [Azospirillum oleiclasticum]